MEKNNTIIELIKEMTLEEKARLLSGSESMRTMAIERLGIPAVKMADGPHGIRGDADKNHTSFPNLCCLGASWDVDMAYKMGEALGNECAENDISMLLAPGINIKRHILCGRNFEYLSEDPVLAGELGAAYINGLQSKGVGASLKHFACNNQEKDRTMVSADIDERTLREIYLKGFEIAVKKAKPASVMCAYNKVNSIWCSENRHLLTDVLKKDWGYEGFVISDWGAVHDIGKAVAAGLDLQMPENTKIVEKLKEALEQNKLTMEDIDAAVERVLGFVMNSKSQKETLHYDRSRQHEITQQIAASGIVLLKNEEHTLPIIPGKYKEISVIGEYAQDPLICGQGSAEVNVSSDYIDSPLDELKKALGGTVNIRYRETYRKGAYSSTMLWPTLGEYTEFIKNSDMVILFIGSMVSEDTEYFDRTGAEYNPNYGMFIEHACAIGKKVVVVMQSGSAMLLGNWKNQADAILQMWLGGEGAGKAITDVLTGKVNPSGRLPETFPNKLRSDLAYPGNGWYVEYYEKENVGYRYYDRHPEEICYPFGHGLSYSTFHYHDPKVKVQKNSVEVEFQLTNVSETDGYEVVQIYIGKTTSTVRRAEKDLKAFRKVFVKAGQTVRVQFFLQKEDFAYYNVMLGRWITESGEYRIFIAASARDIRLEDRVVLEGNQPYTMLPNGRDMIG